MKASLRALLSGVIDYAGLFPPAALPMDQAVRNYARYRQEPESWMLGRFICPAARLQELAPFLDLVLESGPPLPLSVVGRGGKNKVEFLAGFSLDLVEIDAFHQEYSQQAITDTVELRLPPRTPWNDAPYSVIELVAIVADRIARVPLPVRFPYYEIEVGPRDSSELRKVLEPLSFYNKSFPPGDLPFAGFKLRCGGTEASAFPTAERVAFTIDACRQAGVPLKFTAGLHHPLRHFSATVQTKMHGFLNVFVAGVLAHPRTFGEGQIEMIIKDENPASFRFDDEGLHWKNISAVTQDIAAAREYCVTSFGSCSFDEPRDDLRALGLL